MATAKTSCRAVLAASAALWTLIAAEAAFAQTAAESVEVDENLEGPGEEDSDIIIVTAQKRVEVLSEVPQSITVVGEETLERQQADNFQDYAALVPGLSLTSSTRGVTRIALRGINTGGVASTVAVYVDEVPFGSSSGLANGAILAGDFDTFDVARVEVLRGPQGTLYGASSLGGVLKFVTNPPNLGEFEARGRAGVEFVEGGDLGYSGVGVVNVPIGDKLAIRVNGYYRLDDGFIDTIGNNPIPRIQIPGLTDPTLPNIFDGSRIAEDVNELKSFGGRASVLFEPSETFSVRLTALAQNLESAASNYFEADPATLEPLYGDLVLSQYHPEFTDIKYRIYSGTVDWDIGFANLVSSSSYSTFEQDFEVDVAFGLAPIVSLVAELGPLAALLGIPPITDVPITRSLSAIIDQTTATNKFTQELRLSSPDNDSFEWLVGAYYTHEDSAIDPQKVFAVEAATGAIAPEFPPLVDAVLSSVYEEYAGFANATWHIGPRFDFTFGGRIAHNEQDADLLIDGPLAGGRVELDDLRSSETVFTWSVAPRFELSDNASVYARVATGYRPGGPNVVPPDAPPGTPFTYDSDSTTNYEIGLKADWLDRTFSLDIAAYYIDWKDIQLFAVINDTGVNTNGGTAVSKGVEFTAVARPTRGFSVSFNGAYTDAYLTEDTPPVTGGFDGDPLPYVPKLSTSVNAEYEWNLAGDTLAYVGGSLSFVGERGADFGTRGPDGEIREVPSYETVDLRAGLEAGRWAIQAYVRNLFNVRGETSVFGEGAFPNGAIGVGVIRPRTVGLTVGTEF